jgi:hypothetical protein
MRLLLAGLALCLLVPSAVAQQLVQVQGTVVDTAGRPLTQAEVLIGVRRGRTGLDGAFRVDSIRPGQYFITIRQVGYTPVRERILLGNTIPAPRRWVLAPAPALLPTIVVDERRTGIWGTVGDDAGFAAVGATVQVVGVQGAQVQTDSGGRFTSPRATVGQYLVRVTFPGHQESRVLVELKRGEGKELAIRLQPALRLAATRGDEQALEDLGSRLSLGLRRERLGSEELDRLRSADLCDMAQLRSQIRASTLTIIVNGVDVHREEPFTSLCAWRADEVAMVEFSPDVCRDATQTVALLLNVWCSGRTRNNPRSMMGGGARIATQRPGGAYVVIWEKK